MDFAEIDRERRRRGLTILELSNRAALAPSTYWFIRKGRTRPRRATLEAYARALRCAPVPVSERHIEPLRVAYRAALSVVAAKLGFVPEEVARFPTARRFWKARALAIEAVSTWYGVSQATLAVALGTSRQLVCWNRKQAAEMLAGRKLNELLGEAEFVITGEREG